MPEACRKLVTEDPGTLTQQSAEQEDREQCHGNPQHLAAAFPAPCQQDEFGLVKFFRLQVVGVIVEVVEMRRGGIGAGFEQGNEFRGLLWCRLRFGVGFSFSFSFRHVIGRACLPGVLRRFRFVRRVGVRYAWQWE